VTSSNGASRYQKDKVRVAIIGVGNCANSFVQGIYHYQDADATQDVPGLMHVDLGGYHVSDVEFTCAFDINATKVGKDLGEAIWADPNNTIRFTDRVPEHLGVPVHRGMTHDGLGSTSRRRSRRPRARPPTSSRSSRTPTRTSSCPTCRSAPSRPRSGTSSRSSRPVARS
jgi:myo-inositol-1-phosphate synthase